MTRIITPYGYDYILTSMLVHYINSGFVMAMA